MVFCKNFSLYDYNIGGFLISAILYVCVPLKGYAIDGEGYVSAEEGTEDVTISTSLDLTDPINFFNLLPEEVIIEIITKERILNKRSMLSKVCKHYYSLNNLITKKIVFDSPTLNKSDAEALQENFKKTKKLYRYNY